MTARRTLLVATAGGHIDELFELAKWLAPDPTARSWVTSSTPQTTSLLQGEEVDWVSRVGSRQAGRALRMLPRAVSILRRRNPSEVISTGAALAVPFLTAARMMHIPVRYIESATRIEGPSLTGRILEHLPGTELQHQGPCWERRLWGTTESVFDGYRPVDRPSPVHEPLRVLVSMGTERFAFSRAIGAVASSLPDHAEVVWQLGHTPVDTPLRGDVHSWMSYTDLLEAADRADVIIAHAGVGTILMALRAGKVPLVAVRRQARGEHIDDHQLDLARSLDGQGLAIIADLDDGTLCEQIATAATRGAARGACETVAVD